MLNKVNAVKAKVANNFGLVKKRYQDFRLYDFASYTLNRLTPKKGYTVQTQLAYGLKSRQRFDLFKSEQPLAHRPLIIFVHGGAWLHGDKKITSLLVRHLPTKVTMSL